MVAVRNRLDVHSPQALLRYKHTLKCGASGPGDAAYAAGVVLRENLNPHIKLITGYAGEKEIFGGLRRNEIDIATTSNTQLVRYERAGDCQAVMVVGTHRVPEFPHLGTLADIRSGLSGRAYDVLLDEAHLASFEWEVAASPGVPPVRLAFLRAALRKVLHNPQMIAKAKRARLTVEYLSAGAVRSRIHSLLDASPAFRAALRDGYKRR